MKDFKFIFVEIDSINVESIDSHELSLEAVQ